MSSMIKIVLLQDLSNVGQRNEVKSVRFGFAKNWLIPQKFASLATPRVLAEIAQRQDKKVQTSQKGAEQASAVLNALKGLTLIMRPKKTTKGTLYAAIDAAKISEALKKKKIALDPEMIQIDAPIKKVGEYDIPVIFSKDLEGKVKIVIQ